MGVQADEGDHIADLRDHQEGGDQRQKCRKYLDQQDSFEHRLAAAETKAREGVGRDSGDGQRKHGSDRGDFDRVAKPIPERELARGQQGAIIVQPRVIRDQFLGSQRTGGIEGGGDHPQDRENREEDQE